VFESASADQHPFTAFSEPMILYALVPGMFNQFNQGLDLSSHGFMANVEVS